MQIEQALYGSRDAAGYRFLARSPGFADAWLPEAERLCTDFGEPPAGAAHAAYLFARPFGPKHVAIVQVADAGRDDAGRPGALLFRLLVLPQSLYADLGGDPFFVADQFPVPSLPGSSEAASLTPSPRVGESGDGEYGGEKTPPTLTLPHTGGADQTAAADNNPAIAGRLPTLTWTAGPPPQRTVADLRRVLDVPNSAVLLGGAQALLDGGRLVFERVEPAGQLVRSLWALLPTSSRSQLWPATMVFANPDRFHVAIVPRAGDATLASYVDEVRAGDYPEGRYELALQMAVEHGDQEQLDALFARRSRTQVLRLGVALLAVLVLGPLLMQFLPPARRPASESAAVPALKLPPASACPALGGAEREKLAARLVSFGTQLGIDVPGGASEKDLTRTLATIDARLGTPNPLRDPGPLRDLGPLQRQLRALLWKHAVADYDSPGMNTVELLEKLQYKVLTPALERSDS